MLIFKKIICNFQEKSRKKRVYQKFSHKGTALSQEIITQRFGITELESWKRKTEMERMFTSQPKTSETRDRFSVLLRLTGT